MWRRLLSSSNLKTLTLAAAPAMAPCRSATARLVDRAPASASAALIFSRGFSADSDNNAAPKKKVEDIMPIATGHERDELQAELEGRDIYEIDHPCGPFGTKEAPAVVKSFFDKRIVGCVGGEGEDEHDVIWFWLEKDKPYECPVCSQYFTLEVVGPGGPPGPEDTDDDEHHHH